MKPSRTQYGQCHKSLQYQHVISEGTVVVPRVLNMHYEYQQCHKSSQYQHVISSAVFIHLFIVFVPYKRVEHATHERLYVLQYSTVQGYMIEYNVTDSLSVLLNAAAVCVIWYLRIYIYIVHSSHYCAVQGLLDREGPLLVTKSFNSVHIITLESSILPQLNLTYS